MCRELSEKKQQPRMSCRIKEKQTSQRQSEMKWKKDVVVVDAMRSTSSPNYAHKATSGEIPTTRQANCHNSEFTSGSEKGHQLPETITDESSISSRSTNRSSMCEICGKAFNNKKYLNIHLVSHQTSRPFKCLHCEKTFKTNKAKNLHETLHSGERNYQCDHLHCGKNFKTASNLRTHKLSHAISREFVCSYQGCGKSYKTQNNLNDHMKIHKAAMSRSTFTCYCGKAFLTKRRLNRHEMRFHQRTELEVTCSQDGCGNTYKSRDYLNRHIKFCHNTNRAASYTCEKPGCGRSFSNPYSLRIHGQRVHPKCREFVCKTCAKCFKTKDSLNVHEFSHTDEKPYVCSEAKCGKAFRTKSNLRTHELTHSGMKPHDCQICGKHFRSHVAKRRHDLLNNCFAEK